MNIRYYIKHPNKLLFRIGRESFFKLLSDEKYLKIKYNDATGKKLNLLNPITYNEKIQWLKLNDRKDIYTHMVDKYEAKRIVADMIGEEYIIPTIGVWDSFDDIDFEKLPPQFVLKCTHDSGSIAICKDKEAFDINKTKQLFNRAMKHNYYWLSREWPYKNVKHRIIAEEYMQDGNNDTLPVYKILNFDGEPFIIQTIQNDKTKYETIDYFDVKWNRLDIRQNYPNSISPLDRPQTLDIMLNLARKLSKNLRTIRTDFYEINGKVFFSEFTFYSDSGLAQFYPENWDFILGEKISIHVD